MLPQIQSLIAQFEAAQLDSSFLDKSSEIRGILREYFRACHHSVEKAMAIDERVSLLRVMHTICGSSAFSMCDDEYDIFCSLTEQVFRDIKISQLDTVPSDIAYLLYAYNHNVFDIDLTTPTCSLLIRTIRQWLSSSWDKASVIEALRRLEIIYLCVPEFLDTDIRTAADEKYNTYILKIKGNNEISLLYQLYNTEYARSQMCGSKILNSIASLFDGVNEPEALSIRTRQQLLVNIAMR